MIRESTRDLVGTPLPALLVFFDRSEPYAMVQNSLIIRHFPTSTGVSGESERAKGRARGPVFRSGFMDHHPLPAGDAVSGFVPAFVARFVAWCRVAFEQRQVGHPGDERGSHGRGRRSPAATPANAANQRPAGGSGRRT